VALVRSNVSEEHIASITRVKRLSELGTELAVFLRSVFQLLVTANAVSRSQILFTLVMETIRCFETSILTRTIRRHIQEDGILHSRRRKNFKSYIALTGWAFIAEK
jgi:hypothetical protein